MNDGRAEEATEPAVVRDGKGATLHFLRVQLLGPRAFGQVGNFLSQLREALAIRVSYDRNQQPVFQRHGDSHVDVLLDDDTGLPPGRVHDRDIFDRSGNGIDHERQVRQTLAFPEPDDRGEVGLEERGHMGGGLAALDHPLRDGLSHRRERQDLLAGRRYGYSGDGLRPGGFSFREVIQHIFPGHATTGAGASDLGKVHALLLGQLPDGRGVVVPSALRGLHMPQDHTSDPVHDPFGLHFFKARDQRADGHGLAFLDEHLGQVAGGRRGNLQRYLVGLDLQQRLVLLDPPAQGNQPLDDRSLRDALPELRHDDVSRHLASLFVHRYSLIVKTLADSRLTVNAHQYAASFLAAATMSPTLGKKNSSNGVLNGTGVSGAAILMIGPSRLSKHSSASNAATSAPIPPVLLSSWSVMALPVFRMD